MAIKTNRKKYPHEELMEKLHLTMADLPPNTQDALREFARLDAQEEGYQPELEPASAIAAEFIREWYDMHETDEEHLPLDLNERACHVAFHIENLAVVTSADFKRLGGVEKLNNKNIYKVGKFRLQPEGKGHKIVNEAEENDN